MQNKLIAAPTARREYLGNISNMTEWRWRRAGILPEPVRIRKRNFYREDDLLAVPKRAAAIERREAEQADTAGGDAA